MGMDAGKGPGPKADINVTPLVDVLLVLLIIFMTVISMALGQRGYDVAIPEEQKVIVPPNPEDPKPVMLAVAQSDCDIVLPLAAGTLPPNCSVRLNDESVLVTELPKKLDAIFKVRRKADRILFLAAEEKLNYGGVVQILDVAKNAVGEDLKVAVVSDEKFAAPRAAEP